MVANFAKKRKRESTGGTLLFQIIGVVSVIVIIFLVAADFNMHKKRQALVSQINFYEQQIQNLKDSNAGLKEEIANADDIDYLEKIAYEQLGEQKPGEKAVTFVASEEKLKEAPKQESSWTGWLSNTWNWIKSRF